MANVEKYNPKTPYQQQRDKLRARVQDLKAAGWTQARIGKTLSLSRDQVARLWKSDGTKGRPCEPYSVQEIERLVCLNYGDTWIAHALGISRSTVYSVRRRLGLAVGVDFIYRDRWQSKLIRRMFTRGIDMQEAQKNIAIYEGCKMIPIEEARRLYREDMGLI